MDLRLPLTFMKSIIASRLSMTAAEKERLSVLPLSTTHFRKSALDALQVDFFGKSSHAGAHPEEGINALDAAIENGAEAMAMAGAEVLTSPKLLSEIKAEFEESKKSF